MPLELLPLELLHLIIEFLDSKKDLSSLTRVSKCIHYRTYDILFRRHYSSALLWACENGIKKTAQLALSYHRNIKEGDIRRKLEIKEVFIQACEGGHVDLVKIMLTEGVLVTYGEDTGISGLRFAAQKDITTL
jgi:hypothetical protein